MVNPGNEDNVSVFSTGSDRINLCLANMYYILNKTLRQTI